MKWVVNKIILPSFFCFKSVQRCLPKHSQHSDFNHSLIFAIDVLSHLLEYGSTPAVGSSRNITFGSPIRAIPTDSFLFCPPERFLDETSVFSTRSTSLMMSVTACSMSDSFMPYITTVGKYCPENLLLLVGGDTVPWFEQKTAGALWLSNHQIARHVVDKFLSFFWFLPSDFDLWCQIFTMRNFDCWDLLIICLLIMGLSYPQMLAFPDDGDVIPVRMLNSVDLPAPLWPRMAVISFG